MGWYNVAHFHAGGKLFGMTVTGEVDDEPVSRVKPVIIDEVLYSGYQTRAVGVFKKRHRKPLGFQRLLYFGDVVKDSRKPRPAFRIVAHPEDEGVAGLIELHVLAGRAVLALEAHDDRTTALRHPPLRQNKHRKNRRQNNRDKKQMPSFHPKSPLD
jgi:hypothetical protein